VDLKGGARQSDLRRVSRQVTIAFALLLALGILLAAMAWSTAARSAPPPPAAAIAHSLRG